jgi:hypothetical protein
MSDERWALEMVVRLQVHVRVRQSNRLARDCVRILGSNQIIPDEAWRAVRAQGYGLIPMPGIELRALFQPTAICRHNNSKSVSMPRKRFNADAVPARRLGKKKRHALQQRTAELVLDPERVLLKRSTRLLALVVCLLR